MKLVCHIRKRLFAGKSITRFPLQRRDDLFQRVNRFMEALSIDATRGDEQELRNRLSGIIERYMELDNCPDIRPQAGLW